MLKRIVILALAASCSSGQTVATSNSFTIDPDRPYTYLKFDHIGPGIQRNEKEPNLRIWLRLVNNCKVAIAVRVNGIPKGSPQGEVGVMDEVLPVSGSAVMVTSGGVPLVESQTSTRPEQKPSVTTKREEMPIGYMAEVGSSASIPSGTDILFSVPVNHVDRNWYFEIPFRFDLPQGKGPRAENVGGEPINVIRYTLWDLPPEYQRNYVDTHR